MRRRTQEVGEGPTIDLCDPPAERELSYHVRFAGLAGKLQRTFGLSTGEFTIVCVDGGRRITEISQLHVD